MQVKSLVIKLLLNSNDPGNPLGKNPHRSLVRVSLRIKRSSYYDLFYRKKTSSMLEVMFYGCTMARCYIYPLFVIICVLLVVTMLVVFRSRLLLKRQEGTISNKSNLSTNNIGQVISRQWV